MSFKLEPGETVKVHTGKRTDTNKDLYWKQDGYVWNNRVTRPSSGTRARPSLTPASEDLGAAAPAEAAVASSLLKVRRGEPLFTRPPLAVRALPAV
jgi:hypothetical protein